MNKIPIGIFLYQISKYFGRKYIFYSILYVPFWYCAVGDFHYDTISIPLIFQGIVYARNKSTFKLVTICILLLCTKEIFSISVIGLCIYYLIYNKIVNIYVISIGIVAFLWFYVTTQLIIPSVSGERFNIINSDVFNWVISDLSLLNIKEAIFIKEKIVYICIIFASIAFVSLLDWKLLILMVLPILSISIIAKDMPVYYSYTNHYTAGIIAPVLFSTFNYIKSNINNRFHRITSNNLIYILILFHITFSDSPLSRFFWTDKIWGYGYKSYFIHNNERANLIDSAIAEVIPTDPSISVTVQNSINNSYLANRLYYLPFPEGFSYPHRVKKSLNIYDSDVIEIYSDYLIMDNKGPKFLMEKGCIFLYMTCQDQSIVKEIDLLLNNKINLFVEILKNDHITIYKRKSYE